MLNIHIPCEDHFGYGFKSLTPICSAVSKPNDKPRVWDGVWLGDLPHQRCKGETSRGGTGKVAGFVARQNRKWVNDDQSQFLEGQWVIICHEWCLFLPWTRHFLHVSINGNKNSSANERTNCSFLVCPEYLGFALHPWSLMMGGLLVIMLWYWLASMGWTISGSTYPAAKHGTGPLPPFLPIEFGDFPAILDWRRVSAKNAAIPGAEWCWRMAQLLSQNHRILVSIWWLQQPYWFETGICCHGGSTNPPQNAPLP